MPGYLSFVVWSLWCTMHSPFATRGLRISIPHNSSQHLGLYFVKTLGMLKIKIQTPQNGYSAEELQCR